MSKVSLDEAQALAMDVLHRVGACDIRLANLKLSSETPTGNVTLQVSTELTIGADFVGTPAKAIICVSRYVVEAKPAEEDADEDGNRWSILVEHHGQWSLGSVDGLDLAHAQAFALAVGSMALHPYARAEIQSRIEATGYPGFTLDVMQSLLEPDEDGLIDLSIVRTRESS
jgi:hypothetical protein